jgi:hypothetical protein
MIGGMRFKPRSAIVFAVDPCRAIQDGAYHFQAAIDRNCAGALSLAQCDEELECAVMDALRFEIAEVPQEKLHVAM